jgi:hypothetical protein
MTSTSAVAVSAWQAPARAPGDAIITMSEVERDHYLDWRIAPAATLRTIYSGQDYTRFAESGARGGRSAPRRGRAGDDPLPASTSERHTFFFAAIGLCSARPRMQLYS